MEIEIEIGCPECGQRFKVTPQDVANQTTKQCPSGHEIKLKDEGGNMRDINDRLKGLM